MAQAHICEVRPVMAQNAVNRIESTYSEKGGDRNDDVSYAKSARCTWLRVPGPFLRISCIR